MGRNRNQVRVHSSEGRYLRTVGSSEAHEMLDKGSAEIAGTHRGLPTSIKLLSPERNKPPKRYRPALAITPGEMERNALAHVGARLSPEEEIGPYQRAIDKVNVWPEIFDDRAVLICGGRVRGQ